MNFLLYKLLYDVHFYFILIYTILNMKYIYFFSKYFFFLLKKKEKYSSDVCVCVCVWWGNWFRGEYASFQIVEIDDAFQAYAWQQEQGQ